MKKSVNILGVVFLIILVIGVFFKKLHLAGAGILTTTGIFLFIAVYFPLFILSLKKQMKAEGSSINSVLMLLGFTGITGLTFGVLAKIMHWPGANIGLWGGAGVLSLALLLYITFSSGDKVRFSMISVLIVIIILGTISFNSFRMGNIRPISDAYSISKTSFSETSRLLWLECEKIMNNQVLHDSTLVDPALRNDLMKMHALVQETDLCIGSIIEKIRNVENSEEYLKQQETKYGYMNERIYSILSAEDGLPELDRKINKYRNLIESLKNSEKEEMVKLSASLKQPFSYEGSELIYNYIGINQLAYNETLNSMFLWKSKIWETEYLIISRL